jgi:hypothetical protein
MVIIEEEDISERMGYIIKKRGVSSLFFLAVERSDIIGFLD